MKRINLFTVVILSLISLVVEVGCSHRENSTEGKSANNEVMGPKRTFFRVPPDADVAADFEESMKTGDLRFVGVMRYAIEVPGVPDYYRNYSTKYAVKIIEGTTDTYSDEDTLGWKYAQFYENYAARYNVMLVDHIKQLPNP